MAKAFQFRSLLGIGQNGTDSDNNSRAGDTAFGDVQASRSRGDRSLQVRENLDVLMRQIEHARHDADQMMEEMSALEVDAGQAGTLRRDNAILRERLDDATREASAEAAKYENAMRDTARLKDELERVREDYEKSQREANANSLDAQRIEERLHNTIAALDEAKLDLEIQREAKNKAEVDAACLRANLAERDKAQSVMMQEETELRMQTVKLQSYNEELNDTIARKERSILEQASQLEGARDRISELEAQTDASRDEIRTLSNKYSDFKVSQESRIFSLNNGLEQERESHRMTRKLLDEERANNDLICDDKALFKDQALIATKEMQKYKRELTATRAQIHEYGDRLKEAHLQISSAQSDIARLEDALEDAKRDTVSLRRQANKSDQLLRENTDLHDKIASIQQRLERSRSKVMMDDAPIILSSGKHTSPAHNAQAPAKKTKSHAASAPSAAPTANVARIRRR